MDCERTAKFLFNGYQVPSGLAWKAIRQAVQNPGRKIPVMGAAVTFWHGEYTVEKRKRI